MDGTESDVGSTFTVDASTRAVAPRARRGLTRAAHAAGRGVSRHAGYHEGELAEISDGTTEAVTTVARRARLIGRSSSTSHHRVIADNDRGHTKGSSGGDEYRASHHTLTITARGAIRAGHAAI